jgi:hypothetical protein
MPAKVGIQREAALVSAIVWIPAFAGMTPEWNHGPH